MARVLVLGAGYIGAKLGELALAEGHDVLLADNWFATERSQLDGLAAAGAHVETADIREDITPRKRRPLNGVSQVAPTFQVLT